jgi:hypothetical protein
VGPKGYCEPLLLTAFGATSVESVDYSDYENASYVWDMNKPIPDSFGTYDTVLDLGTSEHVFDIAQCLRNMIALCRSGGQLMHVAGASGHTGHGFWQFSPELFYALYSPRNGFIGTEVFLASVREGKPWYRVVPPQGGGRVLTTSLREVYVICRTVKADSVDSDLKVLQSDYEWVWKQARQGSATQTGRKWWKPLKNWRLVSSIHPNLQKIDIDSYLPPTLASQ